MKKPYVICHMLISVDGKVTGDFLLESDGRAHEEYYRINREFNADAFACGRVTMEESFTNCWYPDLNNYEQFYDTKSDFVAKKKGFYAVAFDRFGRLGWKTDEIIDEDPGYGGAHIIEVLTESTDARYLSYLRSIGVSYIFAGKSDIDVVFALDKLSHLFGIKLLLLEGGSILDGAFLRAGAVDELSLVQVPLIAGADGKPLFYDSRIEKFSLVSATPLNGGAIWLRLDKAL